MTTRFLVPILLHLGFVPVFGESTVTKPELIQIKSDRQIVVPYGFGPGQFNSTAPGGYTARLGPSLFGLDDKVWVVPYNPIRTFEYDLNLTARSAHTQPRGHEYGYSAQEDAAIEQVFADGSMRISLLNEGRRVLLDRDLREHPLELISDEELTRISRENSTPRVSDNKNSTIVRLPTGALGIWPNGKKIFFSGQDGHTETDQLKISRFITAQLETIDFIKTNPAIRDFIVDFNQTSFSVVTEQFSSMRYPKVGGVVDSDVRKFLTGLYAFLPQRNVGELLDNYQTIEVVQTTDYGFLLTGRDPTGSEERILIDLVGKRVKRVSFLAPADSDLSQDTYSAHGRYWFGLYFNSQQKIWVLARYSLMK